MRRACPLGPKHRSLARRALLGFLQHLRRRGLISVAAAAKADGGRVTRTVVRETRGRVVCAAVQLGVLRYLVHEDGRFVREDGRAVLHGGDPGLRFWLRGDETLVGRGGEIVCLGAPGEGAPGSGVEADRARGGSEPARERLTVDVVSSVAAIATNGTHRVRAYGGQLLSKGPVPGLPGRLGGDIESRVGDVLAGQTRIWIGDRLGFGLYRAGGLSVAFVFSPGRAGLADGVKLPYPAGQVLDHEVVFSEDRVWVLYAVESGGRTRHLAAQIAPDGSIEALGQGEAGDGSWLGTLGGKCAVGRSLLCPTDSGVVRVGAAGATLAETRRFEGTEPFVSAASRLLAGPDGLFVVEPNGISMLRVG